MGSRYWEVLFERRGYGSNMSDCCGGLISRGSPLALLQPFKRASSCWGWGCRLLTARRGWGAGSCGRSSRQRRRTWWRRWRSSRWPMSTNRGSWRPWGRYCSTCNSYNFKSEGSKQAERKPSEGWCAPLSTNQCPTSPIFNFCKYNEFLVTMKYNNFTINNFTNIQRSNQSLKMSH